MISEKAQPDSGEQPAHAEVVCECERGFRSACKELAFFREHEGKRYCVLHYPASDKAEQFGVALQGKLAASDFDFAGVFFPGPTDFNAFGFTADADLKYATFSAFACFTSATFSAKADFSSATFSGPANFDFATFNDRADFSSATFSANTYFRSAEFRTAANFSGTTFLATSNFSKAIFDTSDFSSARFEMGAHFGQTKFGTADFKRAKFSGIVRFSSAIFRNGAGLNNASFNDDADFQGAMFCADANFGGVTFGGLANFSSVTFAASAYFNSTGFSAGAYFTKAMFETAGFSFARFGSIARFRSTMFKSDADFSSTKFSADVNFNGAMFSAGANFDFAKLDGYVRFAGEGRNLVFTAESSLSLQQTRIKDAGCISFHTLLLRPHWFVNVDARKFEFINVEWAARPRSMAPGRLFALLRRTRSGTKIKDLPSRIGVAQEIRSSKARQMGSAHRLLSIACRNLAVNAEENNRYEEASTFRYMAMESLRRERAGGFAFWSLNWWYWLASGYGERWRMAAGWLLAIVFLIFPVLYTQVAFQPPKATAGASTTVPHPPGRVGTNPQQPTPSSPDSVVEPQHLAFGEAVTYSLETVTFQKPDLRPMTFASHLAISLELILGPLQAALLALAIRRKFMR